MPSESYELRFPVKKLLIGLLVTVIPICIAGLYSISHSDKSLEATIGTHFRTIAESTAAEVSQFVHDRVIDVGVMATAPPVVDAIVAANQAYQGMDDAAIAARAQRIEKMWPTPAADPIVNAIVSSRASRFLRQHRQIDRRFLRITVTDARGATVAATHKTLDYFQADEEYWQNIWAAGRGAVSLTDILYDEVTKSNYIGVGVPVLEEGSNRFIGTVDALVDVSSLMPFVNRVQIGPTARAMLVKEDGTIIAAPHISLSMNLKSEEYATVREALQTLSGRQTGYVVADVRGGSRTLIGFADTGLKGDYQKLGWVVLISQDAREALAPIRTVTRFLAFMALIGLLTVMFLAVYFSLHRTVPLAHIEALHAEKTEAKPAGEVQPAPSRPSSEVARR